MKKVNSREDPLLGDVGIFFQTGIDKPPGGYPPMSDIKGPMRNLATALINRRFIQAADLLKFQDSRTLRAFCDDFGIDPEATSARDPYDELYAEMIPALALWGRLDWPIYYVDDEFAKVMDDTKLDPQVSFENINLAVPAGMLIFKQDWDSLQCAAGVIAHLKPGDYSLFEKENCALGYGQVVKDPRKLGVLSSMTEQTVSDTANLMTIYYQIPKKAIDAAGIDIGQSAASASLLGGCFTYDMNTCKTIGDFIKTFESIDPIDGFRSASMAGADIESRQKYLKVSMEACLRLLKVMWVAAGTGREHLIETGGVKLAPKIKKGRVRFGFRHPGFIGRKYSVRNSDHHSGGDGTGTGGHRRLHLRKGHIRGQRKKNWETGEFYHEPIFIDPVWVGGKDGEKDAKLEELERLEGGKS